jgi:hypothetical protein
MDGQTDAQTERRQTGDLISLTLIFLRESRIKKK